MNFDLLKIVIKLILKIAFYAGVFGLAISFFLIEKLPEKNDILEQTYKNPGQTPTDTKPFEIEREGVVYVIKPVFNYELNGLIVSYNHSSNWLDYYHKKWEDFINVKDDCVVWGENIGTEVYKDYDFSSGSFTCYARSKPGIKQEQWSKFKGENLSNNHLLSGSDEINKKIMKAKKGDQIHLEGYLVEYSKKDGPLIRKTSTTRTDDGNGACETVFLTDFEVTKEANPLWRDIFEISQYLAMASFLILSFMYLKDI